MTTCARHAAHSISPGILCLLVCMLALTEASPLRAQNPDDINLQIHGFAAQGFLFTTQNNILTTNSSEGSAAWTEAVLNVTATPAPALRIAVQGRYFLLGNLGNQISLDFAQAEYKLNERIGVRFGKVKVPSGLFNETQDVDSSYSWSLLPQSIYDITSRNSELSDYGGLVYGTAALGNKLGKLDYRVWGGESVYSSDDGFFIGFKDAGLILPNGISESTEGATLRWKPAIQGLLLGASAFRLNDAAETVQAGPATGVFSIRGFVVPFYFARLERRRFMLAGEYNKFPPKATILLPGVPPIPVPQNHRAWYAMAAWKFNDKLTAGIYHSQFFNRLAPLGPARYSKDWTLSGRYDLNQNLYLKAEQHFIDGTAVGYDTVQNPSGLQPNTRLSILKLGVVF